MKRTTILTDEDVLLKLKILARREKTSVTDLINRALNRYLEKEFKKEKPSFVGIGRSGKGNISRLTDQ